MNKPVFLSDRAVTLAEARARAEGYDSIEAYVDALIESDAEEGPLPDWMRQRIEEGLASPNTGEMTRTKLAALVSEGMARARKE